MTTKRAKGTQIRTDWRRKGVGRIRVAYGYTAKAHGAFLRVLDELWQNDCLDALRAIRDGRLSPKTLMEAKRDGRHLRADLLDDVKKQRPLWATLAAMIDERTGSPAHKRRMRDSLAKLHRSGVCSDRARIADLADVKPATIRPFFGSAVDWNHLRKAILTPLSQLFGDPYHPFRRQVLKALGEKETEAERETDVTPAMFWHLIEALPEPIRPAIVTLVATGMRKSEYLRCTRQSLRPHLHAVHCPGSKNADAKGNIYVSADLWPWIEQGIPAPRKELRLREWLHRAAIDCGLGERVVIGTWPDGRDRMRYQGLRLHDLRHWTAHLAIGGGAQLHETQALMRHADPKMTMRYLKTGNQRAAADAIGRALEQPPERAD